MLKFLRWMKKASKKDKEALASAACTSVHTLYQMRYTKHPPGPDLALRLEKASLSLVSENNLPTLRAGDLSPICSRCPHYIQHQGKNDSDT